MTKAGQAAVKVNNAKGTQIPVVYCIQSILSVNLSIKVCRESIGVKMKSWIAESDFLFRNVRVLRRQPSTRLQALVGENQNASAAAPLSKPENTIESTPFSPLWTRSWPKLRIGSVEMTKIFFVC